MRQAVVRAGLTTLAGLWLLGSALAASLARPADERTFLEGDARGEYLARIERAMASLESLEARFDQDKHLSLFQDVVRSKGVIRFARPDHLRWEITEPFRSILVVSGDQVAKFEVEDGVVKKLNLGKGSDVLLMVMGRIRGWFQGRFADAEGDYELSLSAAPTPLIVLRPRDARLRQTLQAIDVHLSDDLTYVRQVTIHEPGGDRTELRFQEPRRNRPLPDGTFSLEAPELLDERD